MSQDASTRLLNPSQNMPSEHASEEILGAGVASQAEDFPVESYADRLMDELFEEVEGMVDAGLKPPAKSEPIEEPPAQSSPLPSLLGFSLASRFRNSESSMPGSNIDQALQPFENEQTADSLAAALPNSLERAYQSSRSYDRLLLGIGCISIITTLALWLLFQEAGRQSATAPTQVTATINAEANVQFADYMQRSLLAIDQKSQGSGSAIASATDQPGSNLPTVTVPGTLTPGVSAPGSGISNAPASGTSTTPATGLARVYGSAYQLPKSLYPSGTFSFPSAPISGPLPTAPARTGTAPVKQPIPLQVPGVARTLVGVVELGEQSAILVEVNGVSQRFRLGEGIGSSGWTLVEVSKNQAIIRRNGEVRSVFIGQNF